MKLDSPGLFMLDTTLGRNRCQTLLRRLSWHAGFRQGQSPEQYGARPLSCMSPVTFCYSVRVVRHWCTITGFSAIMQHSIPS